MSATNTMSHIQSSHQCNVPHLFHHQHNVPHLCQSPMQCLTLVSDTVTNINVGHPNAAQPNVQHQNDRQQGGNTQVFCTRKLFVLVKITSKFLPENCNLKVLYIVMSFLGSQTMHGLFLFLFSFCVGEKVLEMLKVIGGKG